MRVPARHSGTNSQVTSLIPPAGPGTPPSARNRGRDEPRGARSRPWSSRWPPSSASSWARSSTSSSTGRRSVSRCRLPDRSVRPVTASSPGGRTCRSCRGWHCGDAATRATSGSRSGTRSSRRRRPSSSPSSPGRGTARCSTAGYCVLAATAIASPSSSTAVSGPPCRSEPSVPDRRRYCSCLASSWSHHGSALGMVLWSAWSSARRSFGLSCGFVILTAGFRSPRPHAPPARRLWLGGLGWRPTVSGLAAWILASFACRGACIRRSGGADRGRPPGGSNGPPRVGRSPSVPLVTGIVVATGGVPQCRGVIHLRWGDGPRRPSDRRTAIRPCRRLVTGPDGDLPDRHRRRPRALAGGHPRDPGGRVGIHGRR